MRCVFFTVAGLASAIAVALSCGGSIPQPDAADQPMGAFIAVPYPPPAGKVEYVPPRPTKQALWVSGQWRWSGGDWIWEHGGWFDVPDGVGFARWETKRDEAGRLLFAASSWRDARGQEVARPPLLARAAAGPETMSTDAGAPEERAAEGGLADAPSIFDGALFDGSALRAPLVAEKSLLDDGGSGWWEAGAWEGGADASDGGAAEASDGSRE